MPVPVFSVNEVLTSSAMNQVGLWRINTCTVTSVGGTAATASNGVITIGTNNTSVTVNNAFSTNFENYLITVNNGVASADGDLRCQLGSSSTGYKNQILYATYSGTPLAFSPAATQWNYVGSSGTNELQAFFHIYSPFLSNRFTKCTAQYANSAAYVSFGGVHEVNASYTSFTLIPSTGNISGGQIRVYGYNK